MSVAVKSLPIRERLAQLFMVGYSDRPGGQGLDSLIGEHKFTSFIVFAHNAGDEAGLSSTIAGARAHAESLGLPPLLFASDEEGGLSSPLGSIVGRMPSAMALGAGGSAPRARRAATLVGARLKRVGLDLVLAPVLDVNARADNPVIGTRSFGDDPPAVAEMGAAVIEGFQDAGLACCAKHFPGHGATGEDSHLTLPVVGYDASVLEARDLVPFRRAFELDVAAAMTAHVAYPAVVGPPPRPATVSRRIQTDLLRGKLGFNGTLLSDSLEMKGLAGYDAPEKACVSALKAGVDLFICVDAEIAVRCLREIRRAMEEGDVAPRAVERALSNVASLKRRTSGAPASVPGELPRAEGGEAAPRGDEPPPARGEENLESVLDECYAASVTAVGFSAGDIAGQMASVKRGLFIMPDGLPGYGSADVSVIRRELEAAGMGDSWEVHSVPFDPSRAAVEGALSKSRGANGIILCTLSRGPEPSGQVNLAHAVSESGKLQAAVALLDPYGLSRLFEDGTPGIAVYGFWPGPLSALAKVIFAGGKAPGVLPVDIGTAS